MKLRNGNNIRRKGVGQKTHGRRFKEGINKPLCYEARKGIINIIKTNSSQSVAKSRNYAYKKKKQRKLEQATSNKAKKRIGLKRFKSRMRLTLGKKLNPYLVKWIIPKKNNKY